MEQFLALGWYLSRMMSVLPPQRETGDPEQILTSTYKALLTGSRQKIKLCDGTPPGCVPSCRQGPR